jgi:hypothetical protein
MPDMPRSNRFQRWVAAEPHHEILPWPGLKAADHLSRVVCRAIKEAKETRETETWAKELIACLLNHVTPERIARLVFREARRRKRGRRANNQMRMGITM